MDVIIAFLIIASSLFVLFKVMKAIAFSDAKRLRKKWWEFQEEERREKSP